MEKSIWTLINKYIGNYNLNEEKYVGYSLKGYIREYKRQKVKVFRVTLRVMDGNLVELLLLLIIIMSFLNMNNYHLVMNLIIMKLLLLFINIYQL